MEGAPIACGVLRSAVSRRAAVTRLLGRTNGQEIKPAKSRATAPKRDCSDILYEVKDQVAWVTINRPRVRNAFREQTLDQLIDALGSTRKDPSIACAVVTGAGDQAFSAGGDFYAMKRLTWINAYMWN